MAPEDFLGLLALLWLAGLVAASVVLHNRYYSGLRRGVDVVEQTRRYTRYALLMTVLFYFAPVAGLAALIGGNVLENMAYMGLLVAGIIVLQWLFGPIIFWLTTPGRLRARDAGLEWMEEYVNRLARSRGYRRRIRVYLADLRLPNAYAVSGPLLRFIVVDRHLLSLLTRREAEAVLAHEVGHIVKGDSLRAIALGFLPYAILNTGHNMIVTGRYYRLAAAGVTIDPATCAALGEYCGYYAAVSISFAIAAPIAGLLTEAMGWLVYGLGKLVLLPYLLYSRIREHRADLHAAAATRDISLITALEKMDNIIAALRHALNLPWLKTGLRGALYIAPAALLSTHPALEQRRLVVELFLQQGHQEPP